MGLVQRVLEEAGICTITLATIPDFTASVGVPRLVGIGYPQGRPLGQPRDVEGQMEVLRACLRALESIREPGGRIDLPYAWPDRASKVRKEGEAKPPPIAKLILRKPWLLKRFIDGDIPEG